MKRKNGTGFIVLGLITVALAILLSVFNIVDNYRARVKSEQVLAQLVTELTDEVLPDADSGNTGTGAEDGVAPGKNNNKKPSSNNPEDGEETEDEDTEASESSQDDTPGWDDPMPEKNVEGDEYIGILSIPALQLNLPVMSHWDYTNLRKAPCRYTGSVYMNNLVICSHNYDDFLGQIDSLVPGDRIKFIDVDQNAYFYQVTLVEILDPDQVYDMIIGDWDLTLFTCTTGAARRIAVRCDRIEEADMGIEGAQTAQTAQTAKNP